MTWVLPTCSQPKMRECQRKNYYALTGLPEGIATHSERLAADLSRIASASSGSPLTSKVPTFNPDEVARAYLLVKARTAGYKRTQKLRYEYSGERSNYRPDRIIRLSGHRRVGQTLTTGLHYDKDRAVEHVRARALLRINPLEGYREIQIVPNSKLGLRAAQSSRLPRLLNFRRGSLEQQFCQGS